MRENNFYDESVNGIHRTIDHSMSDIQRFADNVIDDPFKPITISHDLMGYYRHRNLRKASNRKQE